MNDEIKEILDYFKRDDKNKFGFNQAKILNDDQAKQLLSYITNLQQENESLRARIKTIKRLRKKQTQKKNKYKSIIFNEEKALQDYKSRCEKASDKLSFIDEALENDTLNVPLCIAKINTALNILQKGGE